MQYAEQASDVKADLEHMTGKEDFKEEAKVLEREEGIDEAGDDDEARRLGLNGWTRREAT